MKKVDVGNALIDQLRFEYAVTSMFERLMSMFRTTEDLSVTPVRAQLFDRYVAKQSKKILGDPKIRITQLYSNQLGKIDYSECTYLFEAFSRALPDLEIRTEIDSKTQSYRIYARHG